MELDILAIISSFIAKYLEKVSTFMYYTVCYKICDWGHPRKEFDLNGQEVKDD